MSQADSANTTILSCAPGGTVQYLPEIHRKTWHYIPETDIADMGRDATINSIASGQTEGVVRVIAFDLSTGKCWDASQEIAREVLDQCVETYDDIPYEIREFLEHALGVNYVCACEFEAAR
jgi:hypothetical protein